MNRTIHTGISGNRNHNFTILFDVSIKITVMAGSVSSNSSNIFLNVGMIQTMMKLTIPTVNKTTMTG